MPICAWTIIALDGVPRYSRNGLPELFSSRAMADSQNISKLNGDKVVRVEIREVRTNSKRRKRK
jgi:hypothetical protein